jgi:hypothetical protein
LSQLIHFRCISQTTLSSTAFTAEIAAKAGKLVQPTGPQHLPRSIRELLTMNMTTLVKGMTSSATPATPATSEFRFKHIDQGTNDTPNNTPNHNPNHNPTVNTNIKGTSPADFVRFHAVQRMVQQQPQRPLGGKDDLPDDGPGGNAIVPLYIAPIVATSKKPPSRGKTKTKLIKDNSLVFEWLRSDKICTTGKAPEPKRSFTMTPLADGFTHLVFGGLGLNGGNGRKNDIPHVLFANNLKLEAKIYNETHLLLPMNGLSPTAYASAGVSSDGMTCAPSGPVPVPPKVEPDEPLRP